jgi:hypothetical protein
VSSSNFLLGCLGATLIAGLIAGPFSAESTSSRAYAFTKAPQYRPSAWLAGGERFPSGAQIHIATAERTQPLVPGFAASADPTVSFDGTRVLFSGKRTNSGPWQIWEVTLAGGSPRQLTSGTTDCIKPLYLPDNKIVYTQSAANESFLEMMPLTGGTPVRLTYAPGRYLTNDVLYDGRILLEAQRAYHGTPVRELYTVFPDGTGVESLRCDHGGDRHSARQLSSRDVLFVQGGRLGRFTSALARQTAADQPEGELGAAVGEVSPKESIVSMKRSGDSRFALYRWNGRLEKLQSFADGDAVDPVVLSPRETPRRFPSALIPSRGAANLLCLNAHTTRDAEISVMLARVRVYTERAGKQQLLGEAPVQSDGSFYVQLPGEVPLRMELVDTAGRVVRAEKNWWWMRTGEQRVCVGCHAGPERAPDNEVPLVLQKTVQPVKMLSLDTPKRATE